MKNSIQISIKALLIAFILTSSLLSKGWENSNPIEISGTALYKNNHQAVSEGFVRIIVFNKSSKEFHLIKIVPTNSEGKFSTGKIYLENDDIVRIGAYANDVNWDQFDNLVIKNNYQISDAPDLGAYANDVNWDQFDNLIIKNNNQMSDAPDLGAYANDVNWDQLDNLVIKNNYQISDAPDLGAYANDVNWDQWDNVIINANNQQSEGIEIGAYTNNIMDNILLNSSMDDNIDNMTEINLESNLDNVTIYAERNSNNLDNGGLEFIGTYPRKPILNQNFPNPFNPVTNITYSIATNTHVSIKVYDITGKEITTLVNEYKTPGHYSISFNGTNLSSGFYFYKITAGDYTEMKKMSFLK